MEAPDNSTQRLIDQALELLGLRGRTLANFTKLSSEMKNVIGQNISPVTIYRMSSPPNPSYKPFRFSIALLEDFIAQCQPQRLNYLINNNLLHANKNPRTSALYALLNQLFANKQWDELLVFFNNLDVTSRSLGWERHIVAHAMADFMRNNKVDFSSHPFGKKVIRLHSFSIYYLETFIDFSFPNNYLKSVNAWLSANTDACTSQQMHESIYFNLAIQPYFNVTSKSATVLQPSYNTLVVSMSLEKIQELSRRNPILMARIIGAQILLCHIKKKSLKYEQLLDELFNFHLAIIQEHPNSFERAFCMGILLDTLILCDDKKSFETFIKHTHKSAFTGTGDAIIYRIQSYLQIQKGKEIAEKDYVDDHFFLSDGEFKLHRKLIRKVERWYLK